MISETTILEVLFTIFLFQERGSEKASKKPVDFVIVPESVQKLKSRNHMPNFKITGKLDSVTCSLLHPFTGEVILCVKFITKV